MQNCNINVKFNKVNVNLEGNNVKLYGFQKVVVMLNKTVAGLEEDVSKHKANILALKAQHPTMVGNNGHL